MSEEKQIKLVQPRNNERKAFLGDRPKWKNLFKNWIHQAISYMDQGELAIRLIVEGIEFVAVWIFLSYLFDTSNQILLATISFLLVHTWNWITNGLFWALIIFSFPGVRNHGAVNTVFFLNKMRDRLLQHNSISGIAIFGSVSRGKWHDKSDIDIRFLRRKGVFNLIIASILTMIERFRAFLSKQPMDLYLADDIDFLKKLRCDEFPLLLINKDERLRRMYGVSSDRRILISDLEK